MTPDYPPAAYREHELAKAHALIRARPLATFIVAEGGQPFATPLPMVLDETSTYLLSHLDANNPAAKLIADGRRALAIFHGPSAYISPADYVTRQLPTYNYLQAHVHGTLERIDGAARARGDLYALSRAMEPEGRFVLADDDARVAALLPHIVAFRLHVERVDGRFKLSQDKRAPDREAARAKLERVSGCPIERVVGSSTEGDR